MLGEVEDPLFGASEEPGLELGMATLVLLTPQNGEIAMRIRYDYVLVLLMVMHNHRLKNGSLFLYSNEPIQVDNLGKLGLVLV